MARPRPTLTAADYAHKASQMWLDFSENERALVRIGIFPAEHMNAAESEGYQTHPLVVALMQHAKAVGQ